MTEHLPAILVALVLTMTITYGIVESKLLVILRLAWLMAFPHPGRLLHSFLHCGYCVGWWVAFAVALLPPLELPWAEALLLPPNYIVLLLLLRAFTGREFYHPSYEAEAAALRPETHHES